MLRHKKGMFPHGGLPPVIRRTGRCEALSDKVKAVRKNRFEPVFEEILPFTIAQNKPTAKPGPLKAFKKFIEGHYFFTYSFIREI